MKLCIGYFNSILYYLLKWNFMLLSNEILNSFLNKTAIYLAAESGNKEIVQLLLAYDNLDVNIKTVWKNNLFYKISELLFILFFYIVFHTISK